MFSLRPYQRRAVDLTIDALNTSEHAAPIVVAACGAGKSVLISATADELLRANPRAGKVLVVTHRAELVRQDHDKLPRHLKGSIFSASVGKKDLSGDVIFGNIQSLVKQWHKLPRLQAIFVDECHVASKMYAEFIEKVRQASPRVRIVGYTASPFNGAGVWLHMLPEHRIFTGTVAEIGIGELLRDGYLCPLVPYQAITRLDTSGVTIDTRTGDFAAGQLQAAVDVPELVLRCASEIKSIFAERDSVLVFCAGVEHAHHVAEALGHGAKVVTGKTPKGEREQIIGEYSAGTLKYLVSVDILTTGFDSPRTSGIANLRPSRSPLIWLQLTGRGLRLHPSKVDCLVADWTDNTDFFGPIDELTGRPPNNSLGTAPVRCCDNCFQLILAALRKCPHCGHEYEFQTNQHQLDPETGLIISGIIAEPDGSKWYPVERVEYRTQITRNGAEAIVAEYFSPGRKTRVAESWYNLFHHKPSVANRDLTLWLRRQLTSGPPPLNAREALARAELGGMRVPKMVKVKPGSSFAADFRI